MKISSIPNCCSLAAITDKLAKGVHDSYAGSAICTNSPDHELANISSFYIGAGTEADIKKFQEELGKAEAACRDKSGYMAGAIAIVNTRHDGPMEKAFRAAGWIPLIDWPGGHGGMCTLYFKQIKYLDGKPYTPSDSAKSLRRRRGVLPDWCEQEKKQQ